MVLNLPTCFQFRKCEKMAITFFLTIVFDPSHQKTDTHNISNRQICRSIPHYRNQFSKLKSENENEEMKNNDTENEKQKRITPEQQEKQF